VVFEDATSRQQGRVFPPSAETVRTARAWAADVVAGWGIEVRDVALVVSELVTNAVTHGEGDIRVELTGSATRVRLEVHDQGAGSVVHHHPGLTELGGRGIDIVDRVAPAWGWSSPGPGRGTTVWVSLPIAGPAPSGPRW
jgi:anti-sigma regulatory factor (Ser/Thr protein kinase)